MSTRLRSRAKRDSRLSPEGGFVRLARPFRVWWIASAYLSLPAPHSSSSLITTSDGALRKIDTHRADDRRRHRRARKLDIDSVAAHISTNRVPIILIVRDVATRR